MNLKKIKNITQYIHPYQHCLEYDTFLDIPLSNTEFLNSISSHNIVFTMLNDSSAELKPERKT